MTKILYTFCFLLFTIYSVAQFNVIVEDTTNNHLYAQTIITNSNYIVFSGSRDVNGNRGISIMNTDSTGGNFVFSKIYSKTGEYWYEGYKQNYNDDLKILAGSRTTDKRRGMIMKFDSNFDTIYSKTYYNDTLSSLFFSCTKVYNNNIICTGQVENLNEYANGIIVKYNVNGDVIWSSEIGNGSDDLLGIKTIETYDSSIISIGWTFTGSAIYKQDWYIVKTDSLGNLDWWLHPGNPQLNDGSAMDIIQTKDSCFVVVGGKAVYRDSGGEKFDGRIMKFDIDGNILWDKTYRKSLLEYTVGDSVYCFFNSIVEADNGNLLVAANEKEQQGLLYTPVLYCFNPDGDTLWTKHYCTRCAYANDGQNVTGQEYPTTIQKTDNGGYLIGGWGNYVYTFNHPYEQQMFLIKTDSMGCDGTEFTCPMASVPSIVREKEIDLVVYPNPVKESLTLALSKGEGTNSIFDVIIYDVYGRKVSRAFLLDNEQEYSNCNSKITINVSNLQKGIYFIKVGDKVAKFIKE